MADIVRMRTKHPTGDCSEDAWNADRMGVWYGVWQLDEFAHARKLETDHGVKRAVAYLGTLPGRPWPMNQSYYRSACRFADIPDGTYVLAVFRHTLHLARIQGPLRVDADSDLNRTGEPFHYRQLDPASKLAFPLAELPHVYHLIRAAGRSNVHGYKKPYRVLLNRLIEAKTPQGVWRALAAMNPKDWLKQASPSEWESVCLAYLMAETGFLPVGLVPGKTLRTWDLVGLTRDGAQVLAQCKKDSTHQAPGSRHLEGWEQARAVPGRPPRCLWFSYGSAEGDRPSDDSYELITGDDIREWLEDSAAGRAHWTLLTNWLQRATSANSSPLSSLAQACPAAR